MSVQNLPNLSNEALDSLTSLSTQVEFTGKNRRVGINGVDKMSVYTNSRWYDWSSSQQTQFKEAFDSAHIEKAVVGWFLHLPANTGFLDVMDAWAGADHAGNVVAYSLSDNNSIWIGGTQYHASKGEGYKFSLKSLHEIKTSSQDRDWACLMLMEI